MNNITSNLFINLFLSFLCSTSFSQNYSYDNKNFETIDWNEFFKRIENNPRLVYFDIRTAGEHDDTSQYSETNQGRIKHARQADYFEIEKHYPELLKHKNDTIYLYCSHSMRSRRLAKRLSDSSFKHVVNINGGITYLNIQGNQVFPLRKKYYETSLKYSLVSPSAFGSKLKKRNVQVVDVRPDSIYYETGGDEQDLSYGHIKSVKHLDHLKCIDSIALFDKTKEILLVDNYGDLSPIVANKLLEKGYTKVGVLHFGLHELRNTVPSYQRQYLQTKYPSVLSTELLEMKKAGNIAIIDIRTESEFNSTDSVEWKNAGRLKGAINIPLARFSETTLLAYKSKRLIIYDNMMMPPDLYSCADLLLKYGITNFSLLSGGIFYLNWEIGNTEKKRLAALLDN